MTPREFSGGELVDVMAALANPWRVRILVALYQGSDYVSHLAKELGMSRPLLHMHLQKLVAVGLVGSLELTQDGKAMKFFEVVPFNFHLTPELLAVLAESLTDAPKGPATKDTP